MDRFQKTGEKLKHRTMCSVSSGVCPQNALCACLDGAGWAAQGAQGIHAVDTLFIVAPHAPRRGRRCHHFLVHEQPCRAAVRVRPLGFPWPMGLVADQASSRVAPGCAERLSGWRPMRRVGAAGATTFLSTSNLSFSLQIIRFPVIKKVAGGFFAARAVRGFIGFLVS